MRNAARLTALLLAIALAVAPAAGACCEADAAASGCPMQTTGELVEAPPCHGGDRLAADCCEIERAPAPVAAGSAEGPESAVPLAAVVARVVAVPAPVGDAARSSPPRAGALHDLGRYTLHSSFLL